MMTLYELLVKRKIDSLCDAMKHIRNDQKYSEHSGRAKMCEDLINTLSDETLRTEVVMRSDAVKKGDIRW